MVEFAATEVSAAIRPSSIAVAPADSWPVVTARRLKNQTAYPWMGP